MDILKLMLFELVGCENCGKPKSDHSSVFNIYCWGREHYGKVYAPDRVQESRVRRIAEMISRDPSDPEWESLEKAVESPAPQARWLIAEG